MKNLTEGNIYKNFILFAIPLILAALLAQGYNTVDAIIAGKFLGEKGIAAIGATAPLITAFTSIFLGIGGGFGIYIARLFGGGEYALIKRSLRVVLFIYFAVIAIGSVTLIATRGFIYTVLKIDKTVLFDANRYFVIYMAGIFLVLFNNFFVYICNALGSTVHPLYMSAVSAVLNILGNILSVTVLNAGVTGVAVSTLVAALVVDVYYFLMMRANYRKWGVVKTRCKITKSSVKMILVYSLPNTFQQMVMYMASLFMSPIVNSVGVAGTAGYSVALKIFNINAAVYQASSKTLSNFSSQCVGNGSTDKIRKGLFVGLIQGLIFSGPLILICVFFAKPVCMLFFPDGYTGAGLDYAVMFSRYFMPFLFFNMFNNLFHAFYRGIARVGFLLFSTFFASAVQVMVSYILSASMGVTGVYIGWAVAWIAEFLLAFAVYMIRFRTNDMIRIRVFGK